MSAYPLKHIGYPLCQNVLIYPSNFIPIRYGSNLSMSWLSNLGDVQSKNQSSEYLQSYLSSLFQCNTREMVSRACMFHKEKIPTKSTSCYSINRNSIRSRQDQEEFIE